MNGEPVLTRILFEVEDHYAANYSQNFIKPSDYEAHTQNIEGFWSNLNDI